MPGCGWPRRGTAGHGSMLNDDNAVTALAEAVARVGRHEWPAQLTGAVRVPVGPRARSASSSTPGRVERGLAEARPAGQDGRRDAAPHANPTMLEAGYKVNVIPQAATAAGRRPVPAGPRGGVPARGRPLLGPGVSREFVHHEHAVETTFDGDLVAAMSQSILAQDPDGHAACPYCLSGGTDAKSFGRLGIRCFGFTPLRLSPELDFFGMFHGVDERVPVARSSSACACWTTSWTAAERARAGFRRTVPSCLIPEGTDVSGSGPVPGERPMRTLGSAMVTNRVWDCQVRSCAWQPAAAASRGGGAARGSARRGRQSRAASATLE